jgi:hypothetical protein
MLIDDLVARIRQLPSSKRQKVEEMVRSLEESPTETPPAAPDQPTASRPPLRSARGLLRDLGPAPSEETIDEARREMWGRFPREELP